MVATNSINSAGVEKTWWFEGLTHVSPAGTPRARAISSVTFAPGSTPPIPGLAPCAELEGNALHGVVGSLVAKLVRVESAILGACPEVAGAELPDKVAAVFKVVGRQAAFAGVVREAAHGGALVEGPDRVRRQRAETHGRDIQERHVVGLRAVGAPNPHARRLVRHGSGLRRVHQVLVPDPVDVPLGAVRLLGVRGPSRARRSAT